MAVQLTDRKAPARQVRGTRRLQPLERRKLIIAKAAEFFSEFGFEAATRDLAKHIGTTQPLLYKYFRTKDELISAVYKHVFLDVWKDDWTTLLLDRTRTIQDRLVEFYASYTDVIMCRLWMRIYLFAGLKGVGITNSYVALVEERIIRHIAIEVCASEGIALSSESEPRYIELAWALQGSIFYYGVRKFAWGLEPHRSKEAVIRDVVRTYVAGWRGDCI